MTTRDLSPARDGSGLETLTLLLSIPTGWAASAASVDAVAGESAGASEFIFMFDVAKMSFDDDTFSGSEPQLGLTIGYALNARFEIGYTYSSSFLFSPSLDKGPELGDLESVSTSVQMLYLRGSLPLSKSLSGFALIGPSQIEIETELIRAGLCFGGGRMTTASTTTYRHRQAG